MSNFKRSIVMIILFIFVLSFYVFTAKTFATDINFNLANESNVTDEGNPGNNLRNTNTTPTLNTNTNTSVESIDSIDEYNEPTTSFGFTDILNILLLAVGLVIILLAVAILIRLGK